MSYRICRYAECGADLTGYPPASRYCSLEHAALAKREQEADWAQRNRPLLNLRRRHREAKRAREESGFEPPAAPEGKLSDGRSRPPLIDGVLRGKGEEYTGSGDPDEVDELPWMVQRDDRRVAFHASEVEPPRYDALGRPSPRRTVRAEVAYGQVTNPAVIGALYAPSSVVGQALVDAQRRGSRFGPSVEPPAPLAAGMFPSAPHLQAQENQAMAEQAEHRQAVSEHLRHLGGTSAWRR